MNTKQALRWLHRNCGLKLNGTYHVTRMGETVSNRNWNTFRKEFLALVARVG